MQVATRVRTAPHRRGRIAERALLRTFAGSGGHETSTSINISGPSGAAEGVPGCPTGGVQGHSLMEDVLHIGATKLGLLGLIKATVAALATGLLAKFPLLLLKLLFKVGLLSLVIPVFLPLILPLISGISFTGNNNTTAATRGLPGLREWERWDPNHCLQRFACHMGAHTSGREQTDAVTRLLEKLQMSQVPENRRLLEMYREAYLRGSEEKSCHQHYQTCEMVDGFIGRLT
uniref:Uncharacterized protein n=1 Tax=Timema bartmani TaxID=61472 RepID=A0A7R9F7Y3_9NEOP|nr:unnamed protein product [Timema bartmani]